MDTKHEGPLAGSEHLNLSPADAAANAQVCNAEEGLQWDVIRSWLSRAGMLHVDTPHRKVITG